jgi:amino acid transporter
VNAEIDKTDVTGRPGTMGTFAGVFTPSILTILGIILFMRLGFVVGSAGLGRALLILLMANSISILTTLSLSVVATNLKVKGGGVYYLISRTLGMEFGGAIGIVLFLAQSVSIAFYCIGFGEIVTGALALKYRLMPQVIAVGAVVLLFFLAWRGADWATRFQYVVMGILALALVSFFVGGLVRWDNTVLLQNWAAPADGQEFWILFAIFFPAVTGFTQGVSMSGDLKNPGRSLPLGTFLAVFLSMVIYFGAALVLAAALPAQVMIHDYQAMQHIAWFDFLIVAGVIAATLSSAMASLLGAPRILQSLAKDRIFPFLLPFAKGHGETDNPRRGVLLSAVIALATISLGKLNLIAPVVSMFFLVSYGLLNYATYFEARAASPSFRPRIKFFDYRLSLIGGIGCMGVMLAIDFVAGLVAVAILFGIYQYLLRTSMPARWADSRRSYFLQRVRENLLAASKEPDHVRDWRPRLLVFSDDAARRHRLLQFAVWLEGGSGLISAVSVMEGDDLRAIKRKQQTEIKLQKEIKSMGIDAFSLVVTAANFQQAIQTLIQSFGIGPLKANTVLLNWFKELNAKGHGFQEKIFGRHFKTIFRLGCNIIVLDAGADDWERFEKRLPEERRIDVWWWGNATGRLMLILAYLMTRNEALKDAQIRVLDADYDTDSEKTVADLGRILKEARIDAVPEVIACANIDAIEAYSADTDIVFLPFHLKDNQPVDPFGGHFDQAFIRLPIVAFVLAAEDIELDAEPEEGTAGDIATALDTLADAEKKARKVEKRAEAAVDVAEKKKQEAKAALDSGADEEIIAAKQHAARKAEEMAEKAIRKSAKAKVKAETAARKAAAIGIEPSTPKKDE